MFKEQEITNIQIKASSYLNDMWSVYILFDITKNNKTERFRASYRGHTNKIIEISGITHLNPRNKEECSYCAKIRTRHCRELNQYKNEILKILLTHPEVRFHLLHFQYPKPDFVVS